MNGLGAGDIVARPVPIGHIASLRERYRGSAHCQVVRDSILPRGLADPYALVRGGDIVGYAGVWNRHFPDRILELFVLPGHRGSRAAFLSALVQLTGAKELEAQTNIGEGGALVEAVSDEHWVENILFEEAGGAEIERVDLRFRSRREDDEGPDGDWVIERGGQVAAAGGWLTHYNPPYADLYMEVAPAHRRQGIGAYLIQELRRACKQAGYRPAARCSPENLASRRTLERGGLRVCGEIVAGRLTTTASD